MANISEVLSRTSKTSKTQEFTRAVVSDVSLDGLDTLFSVVKRIAEKAVDKCIQKGEIKKSIELCIRASDSASLSREQINTLVDTAIEILDTATVDIHRAILDENYYQKLAYELAGKEASDEAERIYRVLLHVFKLLSDPLCQTPEFQLAVSDILQSFGYKFKEIDRTIIKSNMAMEDHEKRLQKLERETPKVEDYLKGLPSLQLKQNKIPFAYDYFKLKDIWGRDDQLRELTKFAESDSRRFLFWVVTGPAGIGKSKLVFYFGRMLHQKKNWLVRELNRFSIQKICAMNNWNSEKNILLIIDYANEQEQLPELLNKLSMLDEEEPWKKIRVILIAREGMNTYGCIPDEIEFPQWYLDIICDTRAVSDYLYLDKFIDLEGLPIEECTVLHKMYALNCLGKDVTLEDERIVKQLIEQEILDDTGLARPLYALFVIDAYYKSGKFALWDIASLQKHIYQRDWNRWKNAICGKRNDRNELFLALADLLIYATVFDRWESGDTLPEPLTSACKIVFDVSKEYATDPKPKFFKLLTGKNVMVNNEPALIRLKPDMVGEYYVIMRFRNFDNSTLDRWAMLMALNIVKCRDFFVRTIQDYGNYKPFIETILRLLSRIAQKLQSKDEEGRSFATILETLFRNYKGSEDDQISKEVFELVSDYIKKNESHCVYAAELALLFHENREHIGNYSRMGHFKRVEELYEKWPESRKLAIAYISFLGDIAASKIGAYAPGYYDSYVEKFENLSELAQSSDMEIKRAFMLVLIKMIKRAISIQDWDRAGFFEDNYLRVIMMQHDEDLVLDFINGYDSVIITLAKERNFLFPINNSELTQREKYLKEKIDNRIGDALNYLQMIIDNVASPSLNFTWTYISKLAMIAKNLFINQCAPHNDAFFYYMLEKFQKVYAKYSADEKSILKSYVSHTLDAFCDTKSDAIPSHIKMQCFLY